MFILNTICSVLPFMCIQYRVGQWCIPHVISGCNICAMLKIKNIFQICKQLNSSENCVELMIDVEYKVYK